MRSPISNNEVLVWRLCGAVVWQALLAALALAIYNCIRHPLNLLSPMSILSSCFSFSTWIDLASVFIALSPATALHAAMLTTEEHPAKLHTGLQFVPAPVAVLLRKAASRAGTLTAGATLAAYWAVHALSAAILVAILLKDTKTHPSSYHTLWFAIGLAATYVSHVLYYSRDVLSFPTIQRHRYFRIKQQLPAMASYAIIISAIGCTLGAAISLLAGHGVPGVYHVVSFFAAGMLCTLWWLSGTLALEAVFTERLRPHDYGSRDALMAMTDCLEGKRGVIMRDLALHDLSLLAEDRGKAAWRRTDAFADESGARWRPLGKHCVSALTDLTLAMAEALPRKAASQSAPPKQTAGGGGQRSGMKWNVVPTALLKRSPPVAQRQNIDALESVQCMYQRGKFAARALTGFAIVSLTEDRFGVLQLGDPSLGDVLLSMLSTLLGAKHFLRQVSGSNAAGASAALGPWRGTGDAMYGRGSAHAAVNALYDELTTDLYRIVEAFGPGLVDALGKSGAVPVYGEKKEAIQLLERFLQREQ